MAILAAVQLTKTSVRVITTKGDKVFAGILMGFTSETVTMKLSEKGNSARVVDERGNTIRCFSLPSH